MSRAATLTLRTPAAEAARPRGVQPGVVGAAGALLLVGALGLAAEYGLRHGGLFLI